MAIDEPIAVCSDVFNRAYVLTEEDFVHFHQTGKKWVDPSENAPARVKCAALLRGSDQTLVSDNALTIVQYTNPRKQQIEGMSLVMTSGDGKRTFRMVFQKQEYPGLIQVEVGGDNTEETERLFRAVSAEVHELAQWYSILACRRWARKALMWVFWIFLVLDVAFLVISAAGSAYREHSTRERIREFQREYPLLYEEALIRQRYEESSCLLFRR